MKIEGSTSEFRDNWKNREETEYSHFTKSVPENQIQLAFRNHWKTWKKVFPELSSPGKVLEVGSGRGTLSMYFSQNGWDTTILDLVPDILDHAKRQFADHSLDVNAIVADCLEMPVPDGTYDVVFSVGLLEHFSQPELVLREQVRVLAPGGLLIGYVVPEPSSHCVQNSYEWVNDLLRSLMEKNSGREVSNPKSDVYRSDFRADYYSQILSDLACIEVGSSGTYPLPMISWSTEFPFTLLPDNAELALTSHLQNLLDARAENGSEHPWLCDEELGQAFLVWGRKAP